MPLSTRSTRKPIVAFGPLAVALVVSTACAPKESASTADTTGATAAAVPPAPPPAAPALGDAQIAHAAVTANSIDSAAGEMAKQKGSAKAVKDFAQTMITDHSAVNKQAVALATKLNMTPQENDVSSQLKTAADQATANLQGKSGAEFDRAYIDNEVTFHQTLLDALDKTLIPGAQGADLKALLEKVRPAVAAHLERAKSIQGALGK